MSYKENGVTVEELKEACESMIKKGYGDRHILISTDDEGNGFHTLFFTFTEDTGYLKYAVKNEHDNHSADEIIVLG